MEEKNMEQWNDVKGKKFPWIIIVVLVLIIIGLGAFIFLNKDKLLGESEAKKPEQSEQEEAVTFTEEELQEYVDSISPVSIGPSGKLFNIDKLEVREMSAREKIEYIGHLVYDKQTSTSDYEYSVIAEEDVKNAVEKVYGPESYERVTFNLGCGDYNFREEEGKFYSKTGCGGTTDKLSKIVVTEYKATKTKLEITAAYAFTDSNFKIYKDFDNEVVLDEYKVDYDKVADYLANYIKDNDDKVNHMIYTFESTDGNHYYFTGLTNNK